MGEEKREPFFFKFSDSFSQKPTLGLAPPPSARRDVAESTVYSEVTRSRRPRADDGGARPRVGGGRKLMFWIGKRAPRRAGAPQNERGSRGLHFDQLTFEKGYISAENG